MFSKLFKSNEVSPHYYVYALVDWRQDDFVFYVGKGQNDRAFDHINLAFRTSRWSRDKKQQQIVNIIRNASDDDIEKMVITLAEDLTEGEALIIESIVINDVGLDNLTNKISGLSEIKWDRYANEINTKKVNRYLSEIYELGVMNDLKQIQVKTDLKATLKSYLSF